MFVRRDWYSAQIASRTPNEEGVSRRDELPALISDLLIRIIPLRYSVRRERLVAIVR